MPDTALPFAPAEFERPKRRMYFEILLVLGLSLGASAIYSVVSIINKSTASVPLASQSTTITSSLSPRPYFDLIYQLLGIFFDLVPVMLVLYLLWLPGRSAFARIGFDAHRPGRDLLSGVALAAVVGIPGLGLYAAAHALGINVEIRPTDLSTYWWTFPVLILVALRSALQEEIIMIGYLFTRLREIGWRDWPIIITSAAIRGTYHLYQGFGSFIGNFAMGILFGYFYKRFGRTTPLVVTHFILDLVSFVGYAVLVALVPGFKL
jgi:membrane protease YdiL (CAAX protease family)